MTNGVLLFEMADGTNSLVCIGSANVADDHWRFVAVTVDRDQPDGIRLYVDGVIDQTCNPTAVTGSLVHADPMYFAGNPTLPPGTQIFWKGQLDEIEIFRRALTTAEVESLFGAGSLGKCPLTACEDSSGVPTCEGSCPDPDQVCVESDGGCDCQLALLCEGFDTFPECDGICPDSNWTCVNNGQRCHCEPTTTPCEQSAFPECGGTCPVTGIVCEPDFEANVCRCPTEEPPLCEGFATYPACDGECPPEMTCWNNGQRCHCIPEPQCGDDRDYPTCNGACPDGSTCEVSPGKQDCSCVEETTACTDTVYPVCDGECPLNTTCENVPGTNLCDCMPEPALLCDATPYPTCDGGCPVNEVCRQGPNQDCHCVTCEIAVPGPVGPVIYLDQADKIRWTPVSCALTYNLYRSIGAVLTDLDEDGLADDYGSCLQDDIIGIETVDADRPQPGMIHWYLVTAENFVGQTTLGTNSAGQERTATALCP
jgi:hypothetical protein